MEGQLPWPRYRESLQGGDQFVLGDFCICVYVTVHWCFSPSTYDCFNFSGWAGHWPRYRVYSWVCV